ncbi:MAG: NupC/NupG family nucleoside CNT transporter, partial [Aerococcus urinaeequi]|nr:NupC/NupG family nucleoside CNT transporter [Aerococcus urinaeequi]
MGIIRNIIGVILILAIAYFASWDRKEIKNRLVNIGVMFVLMFIVAFVSLRTTFGISLLQGISNAFAWLNVQAQGGINFVFGGIMFEEGATVFFFNVLLPIVFFSALIGIL